MEEYFLIARLNEAPMSQNKNNNIYNNKIIFFFKSFNAIPG